MVMTAECTTSPQREMVVRAFKNTALTGGENLLAILALWLWMVVQGMLAPIGQRWRLSPERVSAIAHEQFTEYSAPPDATRTGREGGRRPSLVALAETG